MMTLFRKTLLGTAATSLVLLAMPASAQQETPSMDEMWRTIQAQQAMINRLQEKLNETKAQTTQTKAVIEQTRQSVEAVALAVESGTANTGMGWANKTSIGGYGELHYEGGAKDQLDFHRFVLFVGHEFNDSIRFFSEIELEHAIAGEGKVGEVELEQAYIEADLGESTQVYGGVHLIPVGLINETHEPPSFYGVERNAVEKDIIPATWWEGGIGVHGNVGTSGFSYDAVISSGLELNAGNGFKVRSGRQKVGKANFKDQAFTGRIAYSGIPGIKLASSIYYQNDVTQSDGDAITGKSVSALLWTANIDAKWNGFGLRALYADWSLSGAEVDLTGRNEQAGFYVEPSYRFDVPMGTFDEAQLGVFYRYADWDNNKGLNNNTGRMRHVFGANFWPIPDVVLKMDYIIEDRENEIKDRKSLNLGIGYQF